MLCLTKEALFEKKFNFGLNSLIVNGESDLSFNGFCLVTFNLIRAEILKFQFLWNVKSWFLGTSSDVPDKLHCPVFRVRRSTEKSGNIYPKTCCGVPKRLVSSKQYSFQIMTSYASNHQQILYHQICKTWTLIGGKLTLMSTAALSTQWTQCHCCEIFVPFSLNIIHRTTNTLYCLSSAYQCSQHSCKKKHATKFLPTLSFPVFSVKTKHMKTDNFFCFFGLMTLFQNSCLVNQTNKIGQFCKFMEKLNTSSLLSPYKLCVAWIIEISMSCASP